MSEYISKERAEICVMSAIEGSEGDDVLRALDDVRLAINSEPAANVAPVVHGHWENKYERHYIFFGTCSVCKHICQENNICGNCGAIMDESEDKNGETV